MATAVSLRTAFPSPLSRYRYFTLGTWNQGRIDTSGCSGSKTDALTGYANEGQVQVLFFESAEDGDVTYADRGGKYQGQRGITIPTVD